jgi:hypothetical protein
MGPLTRLVLAIIGAALIATGSWLVLIEHYQSIDSPGFPLMLLGWICAVKAVTARAKDTEA